MLADILTATVTYRDAAGGDTEDSAMLAGAAAVLRDTRNKAPAFKDSKGNTITMAERSVAETAMGDTDDDAADAYRRRHRQRGRHVHGRGPQRRRGTPSATRSPSR